MLLSILSLTIPIFWQKIIIIYLIIGVIFIISTFVNYKSTTIFDLLLNFLKNKANEYAKKIDVPIFKKYLMRTIFITCRVLVILLFIVFSAPILIPFLIFFILIEIIKEIYETNKIKKLDKLHDKFNKILYSDDEETKKKNELLFQELITTNKKNYQIFYHKYYCSFFINQLNEEILKPYQIFYIEDTYNPIYNKFIEKNHDKIGEISKSVFSSISEFIYIPKQIKQICDNNFEAALNYFLPFAPNNKKELCDFAKKANTQIISKIILKNFFGYEYPIKPGFFVYNMRPTDEIKYHIFKYYYIPEFISDEKNFINYIKYLFNEFNIGKYSNPYRLNTIHDLEDYEKKFDVMSHQVAEELKQQLLFLKNDRGHLFLLKLFQNINADHEKIKNLFEVTTQNHDPSIISNNNFLLSKLLITNDYKILLPDYNNMEIEMTPLPKAVYLLFLHHPEGIYLKYLNDYKEELLHIYKHISYRESPEEIEKSINELIDPTKNSIHEKCSRIKEAFLKKFDDSMAKYYYITGERGEAKSIKLPEHLIIIEAKFKFSNSNIKIINYQTILNKEKQIESLLQQLKEDINKKNYDQAILKATLILQLNPYHIEALQYRAQAYFEIAEYRKAIADDLASLNIKKDLAIAYFNLAEAYYIIKDYPKALENINHFISNYKHNDSESYYLRGLIYEASNDIKNALQDWQKAKEKRHIKASEKINSYLEKKKKKQI